MEKQNKWISITPERRAQLEANRAKEKRLFLTYPELAREWVHCLTEDGKIDTDRTSENTTYGSACKVLWRKQCTPNIQHEWVARVNSRTAKGTGCPFCARDRSKKTPLIQ